MSAPRSAGWIGGFQADYKTLFVTKWSPFTGVLLLLMVIVGLMVNGLVWGVFGGVKYWGDALNNLIGLGPLIGVPHELEAFSLHRMSLMNLTLVLGAFCAALLSGQFGLHRPPPIEYLWAALGGILMGIGAALAGGCTTGGFFNPVLHSSPAGWVMGVGLLAGAALGFKLLLWTLEHIDWGTRAPPLLQPPPGLKKAFPGLGALVALGLVAWVALWWNSGSEQRASRALVVASGFAIGFILHRARLCFARAFREPFVTAEGEMTKAMIFALAVGIPIAALLFQKKVIDPYLAIPASFWIGSLVGGLVFGIGMVFAGGCASGSLWRMGEGHLKLWVAMLFFAWGGSVASALFKKAGLTNIDETNVDTFERTAVGFQAYLPEMTGGWPAALAIGAALLLGWYALVRYNESTERFTLM